MSGHQRFTGPGNVFADDSAVEDGLFYPARVSADGDRALLFLRDLEDAGYVHRQRVGRATRYRVHSSRPFRHPTAAAHQVAEPIAIFTDALGPSAHALSTQ